MAMAAQIIETLAQLGVTVRVIGPDRLRIEPASKVPPDLISRIREAKPEILATLRKRPATESIEGISCRYDWQPGYRGLRMCCVIHHHGGGGAVFRMNAGGYDTLAEMLRLDMLTGDALRDARRVN